MERAYVVRGVEVEEYFRVYGACSEGTWGCGVGNEGLVDRCSEVRSTRYLSPETDAMSIILWRRRKISFMHQTSIDKRKIDSLSLLLALVSFESRSLYDPLSDLRRVGDVAE